MKTALEMTVVGPVMITAMPAWNAWWTGMSWTDFVAKWKRDTLHAWLIGMCAFAPAGLLNYAFVPVRYRVTVTATVSLVWNVYMSYVATKPPPAPATAPQPCR